MAAELQFLRGLVRDVPDFPKAGVIFKDITALIGDNEALRISVDAMAEAFPDQAFDVVVGIESRGFVLGGAVAYRLDAGFVPVRKQGKLPAATHSVEYQLEYGEATLEIHTDALSEGQRVLIVDDLLATGGTAHATIELVERFGAQVGGLVFLIELTELGGVKQLGGRPHLSLLQF